VTRIGVAATAPFGADVLEQLAARHEVAFLLTRPDRRRGRGRKLAPPPAKLTAERLGVPVFQPERLDASVELSAERVVAVAYGLIVPPPLLDRHQWLNVHPSLLPRWRGAAPVERAVMAGDAETGVTIIELVGELDAGPIGARESFPIGPGDDAGAVYDRAAEVATRLLDPLPVRFTPQPGEGVTYAEKITAADRELDARRGADALERQVRALHPHIGARLPEGLGVLAARLASRPTPAGTLAAEDGRLYYGATPGTLELLRVQPPGKRTMDASSYLRGHAV
jgi:methionyl-tRNA formyltransferase